MEVVTAVAALRLLLAERRRKAEGIGLVPTMGALHRGHLSLVEQAGAECDCVVVSIFVNPTQFGPAEDLARYPRDLDGDCRLARAAGAHVVFAPEGGEMYGASHRTTVRVDGLTRHLCGASRPTHFAGVATVVAKLFNIVQPDAAYFGEKDFQQLQVIRRLARDLNFPLRIVGCPIVREADGLALSSRNRYLTAEERSAAPALYRGLCRAAEDYAAGERRAAALETAVRSAALGLPVAWEYVQVVDREELSPLQVVDRPAILAVAASVGGTRLIDNIALEREET